MHYVRECGHNTYPRIPLGVGVALRYWVDGGEKACLGVSGGGERWRN